MKILIDIGHPAHVHYFKNFIWIMKKNGHEIIITARDKEVAFQLLDYYKFPYYNRGEGEKGFFGKLFYTFQGDFCLLKHALKIKPDIFMSFGTIYPAHVAWLLRKPCISFNDTDHNVFAHMMLLPFTSTILTPKVYLKDHGAKHIRFDGFMELCALHPNHFTSNPSNVKDEIQLKAGEKYIVLRFVSWQASHDMGLKGLSLKEKYALVEELSKHIKVIISSETPLPDDLKKYAYRTHPAFMHDLLHDATLLVSESLTMSAEAAFLGTPALCITPAQAGTLDEEVRLGLIELFKTSEGLADRAIAIVRQDSYKEQFKAKSKAVVKNKIDVTAFMVWFVENFPNSFSIMQKTPDYQNRFK